MLVIPFSLASEIFFASSSINTDPGPAILNIFSALATAISSGDNPAPPTPLTLPAGILNPLSANHFEINDIVCGGLALITNILFNSSLPRPDDFESRLATNFFNLIPSPLSLALVSPPETCLGSPKAE